MPCLHAHSTPLPSPAFPESTRGLLAPRASVLCLHAICSLERLTDGTAFSFVLYASCQFFVTSFQKSDLESIQYTLVGKVHKVTVLF